MNNESFIIARAIEETEKWYSENYRKALSIRETALFAIDKFIELWQNRNSGTLTQ